MYTIRHFGNTYEGNGTIRQTLNDNNVDVGQNDPYINGNQASLDDTPGNGSTVTFRPRASGKA